MSQSLAVSVLLAADLEDVAGQSRGAGDELDSAFGLELAIAGMDLGRQDVGEIGPGPSPGAKAGPAAEHHQARSLVHRLGQQLVLVRGEIVGRQVAEDIDVVPARRELGVVDLADLAPGGAADHHAVHLDILGGHDRPHQVAIVPGEVWPLEEHDIQAAAERRSRRC